jgi:hypothetical protein
MTYDAFVPVLFWILVVVGSVVGILFIALLLFLGWVAIDTTITMFQEHKRRPMATRMPLDEIKARRLERAVKGRQDTIKAANP